MKLKHNLERAKPDYAGGSIANLMQTLGETLGSAADIYPGLRSFDPAPLRDAERIILIVIDGLGDELLRHLGDGSCLREHQQMSLTSVYPPTTSSAVTTFLTGVAPQQHGLTGWFMHLRQVGAVTAVLPYVPRGSNKPLSSIGAPLAEVLTMPSFFEHLDTPSIILQPSYIADSEFTRIAARGAERRGFSDADDFSRQLLSFIRGESKNAGTDPRYLYAYWSELDTLSHLHGPSSVETHAHFSMLDQVLAPVLESAPHHGTVVLITADHGFIDSDPSQRIDIEDHPILQQALNIPLCGEPRTAWCYLRRDLEIEFTDYLSSALADQIDWCPIRDLLDEGWFGLGAPHPELAARIGDIALRMLGDHTIGDKVIGERDLRLHGVHGGHSHAELHVPLIVAGA